MNEIINIKIKNETINIKKWNFLTLTIRIISIRQKKKKKLPSNLA